MISVRSCRLAYLAALTILLAACGDARQSTPGTDVASADGCHPLEGACQVGNAFPETGPVFPRNLEIGC